MEPLFNKPDRLMHTAIDENEYYLQDSRSYVGNDVLWWATNGAGYTTDLSKAQVYSKNDAVTQHHSRESDIPWPKSYIDKKIRPSVDMQYIRRDEALKGTGIKLRKPEKFKKEHYRCKSCGVFISGRDHYYYSGTCSNC
jgi:hypothetical protein